MNLCKTSCSALETVVEFFRLSLRSFALSERWLPNKLPSALEPINSLTRFHSVLRRALASRREAAYLASDTLPLSQCDLASIFRDALILYCASIYGDVRFDYDPSKLQSKRC